MTAAEKKKPPRCPHAGAAGRSLRPPVGQGRRSQSLGRLAGFPAAQSLRGFGGNGLARPNGILGHVLTSFRVAAYHRTQRGQVKKIRKASIPMFSAAVNEISYSEGG